MSTSSNSPAPGPRPWPLDCVTEPHHPPPIAMMPARLYDEMRRKGAIRADGSIRLYARG